MEGAEEGKPHQRGVVSSYSELFITIIIIYHRAILHFANKNNSSHFPRRKLSNFLTLSLKVTNLIAFLIKTNLELRPKKVL